MRKLLIALVVVALFAASPYALAHDGPEDMIVWTVAGTDADMLRLSHYIQAASLSLDYVHHVEMEWFYPPAPYSRTMQVRVYFPLGYREPGQVYCDTMWSLVELFPDVYGATGRYLPEVC